MTKPLSNPKPIWLHTNRFSFLYHYPSYAGVGGLHRCCTAGPDGCKQWTCCPAGCQQQRTPPAGADAADTGADTVTVGEPLLLLERPYCRCWSCCKLPRELLMMQTQEAAAAAAGGAAAAAAGGAAAAAGRVAAAAAAQPAGSKLTPCCCMPRIPTAQMLGYKQYTKWHLLPLLLPNAQEAAAAAGGAAAADGGAAAADGGAAAAAGGPATATGGAADAKGGAVAATAGAEALLLLLLERPYSCSWSCCKLPRELLMLQTQGAAAAAAGGAAAAAAGGTAAAAAAAAQPTDSKLTPCCCMPRIPTAQMLGCKQNTKWHLLPLMLPNAQGAVAAAGGAAGGAEAAAAGAEAAATGAEAAAAEADVAVAGEPLMLLLPSRLAANSPPAVACPRYKLHNCLAAKRIPNGTNRPAIKDTSETTSPNDVFVAVVNTGIIVNMQSRLPEMVLVILVPTIEFFGGVAKMIPVRKQTIPFYIFCGHTLVGCPAVIHFRIHSKCTPVLHGETISLFCNYSSLLL